jgi:hypothetical protein
MSLSYNPGGFSPGIDDEIRPMTGEIEIRIPDINRYLPYGPSARVDETVTSGTFSVGYDSATKTLRCKAHQYSETSEGVDASNFAANDVILIKELDPTDPTVVTYWMRTIASVSGNDIILTATLSAPAWDATKKYAICYADYGDATTSQHDYSYQNDDSDGMVEDVEVPYHYSATNESTTFTANTGTDKAEFHATISYGDGVSYDIAQESSAIILLNQLHDRKTAHQCPWLLSSWTSTLNDETAWYNVMSGMVYLGMDQLGTSIDRTLTVAPLYRLGGLGTVPAAVRVILSRTNPNTAPSSWPAEAYSFQNNRYGTRWKRTAEWSVTSSTPAIGADKTLSISIKDLTHGFAWLSIEVTGSAQVRGLSKMLEGVRTVI